MTDRPRLRPTDRIHEELLQTDKYFWHVHQAMEFLDEERRVMLTPRISSSPPVVTVSPEAWASKAKPQTMSTSNIWKASRAAATTMSRLTVPYSGPMNIAAFLSRASSVSPLAAAGLRVQVAAGEGAHGALDEPELFTLLGVADARRFEVGQHHADEVVALAALRFGAGQGDVVPHRQYPVR
jgi:hypothetical protein